MKQCSLVFSLGMITDPKYSLFTYGRNGGWHTFYKPDFVPLFEVEFENPEIEEEAQEVIRNRMLIYFSFFNSSNTFSYRLVVMISIVYLTLLLPRILLLESLQKKPRKSKKL